MVTGTVRKRAKRVSKPLPKASNDYVFGCIIHSAYFAAGAFMKSFYLQFIFLASLVFSLILTPLFRALAQKYRILDRPGHRKTHKVPVSYLGGAALMLSMILGFGLTFWLFGKLEDSFTLRGFLKAFLILGCSLGVALVGLLDDLRNLSARFKMMGQLVFALAFAFSGFQFHVLHVPGFHPADLGLLSLPVTVFWILAVVNAFNMIDGVDGLAATVSAVSLTLLAALTTFTGNGMELILALGALGAVLGFLPFNWRPAKIYLGDAGSGGLGMFLACSLVALGQKLGGGLSNSSLMGQPFFYQILIVTLLVAYPALEIITSVFRRVLHGRPAWRADKGHIHHRLQHLGWKAQRICLAALGLSLLPGLAALATVSKEHGWAALFLVLCSLVLGWGLTQLGYLQFLDPKAMDRLRPHYQIAHHFISMQKVKLSLATTREDVLTLLEQACEELGVKAYRLIVRPDDKLKGGLDYTHSFDPTRLSAMEIESQGIVDRVRLPRGKGGAEWMFEASTVEEDLDVEYQVLISELMKAALERAAEVGKNLEILEMPSVVGFSHGHVSGHHLRKRHHQPNQPPTPAHDLHRNTSRNSKLN
jgi:UDP-GlcNAc:undecaprenyl-phosphate/decaprenyl-phosphate GlcNAc-1-phosphate transferase